MSYTKGPWELVELSEPSDVMSGSFVIRADEAPGGLAHTIGGLGGEERENAKLLLAAPELLEALENAQNLVEELVAQANTCMHFTGINERQQDWVRNEMRVYGGHLVAPIVAAIAKAESE